jgi:hypothetical protein
MRILHNTEAPHDLRLIAEITENKIGVYSFQEASEQISEEKIQDPEKLISRIKLDDTPYKSVVPSSHSYIKDFRNKNKVLMFIGASAIDVKNLRSQLMISDYSMLICRAQVTSSAIAWVNRNATNKDFAKQKLTAWNQANQSSSIVDFCIPFLDDPKTYAIELNSKYEIYFTRNSMKPNLDNKKMPPDDLKNPTLIKRYMWSVNYSESLKSLKPDQNIEIPLNLKWNLDSKACNKRTTIKVKSNAGYLPLNEIETDTNGGAKLRFSSTGLRTGDKVKFTFYSLFDVEISSFQLQVT